MKITITDGNNTVILENSDDVTSEKTRKLMDVLFSVEPNQQDKRTPTVVTYGDLTSLDIPKEASQFREWLESKTTVNGVKLLNIYLGGKNIRMHRSVYSLLHGIPEFAHRLGYARFVIATQWLVNNGCLWYMPTSVSMRTYYSKALSQIKARS